MKNRIMKKNKIITIVEPKEIENSIGDTEQIYTPVEGCKKIWAYYRHKSSKEFYSANRVNTRDEVIFIINYRKGIDEYMKVIYGGEEYSIIGIDDFEGNKRDLKIEAYKIK